MPATEARAAPRDGGAPPGAGARAGPGLGTNPAGAAAGSGLRLDRAIVLAGLFAVTLLSALVVGGLGSRMGRPDSPLFVPAIGSWSLAQVGVVGLMWSVMMAAMMTPSTAPMAVAFSNLERRRGGGAPWAATAAFLAGYLVVWTAFSVAATLIQWGLRSAALMAPGMRTASPWLGGALLLGAGVFQFSSAKDACLRHCRTPVGFLLSEWREGRSGAALMGMRHGAYCVGCCWLLMALMLVVGVMNLAWCAALAVLVLAEKALPGGRRLARAAGVGLAAWGAVLVVGAL
jgi:predicted metal-binding membrane protein